MAVPTRGYDSKDDSKDGAEDDCVDDSKVESKDDEDGVAVVKVPQHSKARWGTRQFVM